MGRVVRKSNIGGLDQLVKRLNSATGIKTKVGWFEGSKYTEGGIPVAAVAAVQEFGSRHVPPRPFIRPTISKKENAWGALAKSGSKAVINGNANPRQVMEGIGLAAEGDIKKAITQLTSPPLKPSTVASRKRKLSKGKSVVGGLDKPLVETGLMLASLTSVVED